MGIVAASNSILIHAGAHASQFQRYLSGFCLAAPDYACSCPAALQRLMRQTLHDRADSALRASLAIHLASRTLEAAARTTFASAPAAYRDGPGSTTELTLAETPLLQAKNASTDAYSAALSTTATLALAAGALGAVPR
jgi:hypothetical protein